jgi:hypothetical protein
MKRISGLVWLTALPLVGVCAASACSSGESSTTTTTATTTTGATGGSAGTTPAGGSGQGGSGQGGDGEGGTAPIGDALTACAKVSTCIGWLPPDYSYGTDGLCTTFGWQEAGEAPFGVPAMAAVRAVMLACIADAADCAAVRACVAATPEQQALCDASGGDPVCDGQVLVTCEGMDDQDTQVFVEDCGAAGLVCGYESCVDALCDGHAGEISCDGDRLVECHDEGGVSAIMTLDCSSEAWGGSTCGSVDGSATVDCVGTGATCDEYLSQDRCEGSVAVRCINGKESSFDCASLVVFGHPYACGGQGKCVAGSDCTDTDDQRCEGGVVSFCLDGVWMDVDCAANGFSGCTTEPNGSGTMAYCVE